MRKIHELRTVIGGLSMDELTVDLAFARPYHDFEDSLQYQCAVLNGIHVLVTRNERDFPTAVRGRARTCRLCVDRPLRQS